MFCQVCGTLNSDEAEFCSRCQQKLLVLSGTAAADDAAFEESVEESFSFDEHLLERISITAFPSPHPSRDTPQPEGEAPRKSRTARTSDRLPPCSRT